MKVEDCLSVCISLDRRPDRWAEFKATADAAGFPVSRMSAVDAKAFTMPVHEHPDISLLTAHNLLRSVRRSHYEIDAPGAVGASLSHFKAWRLLTDSSKPALFVFEDDAELPADFKERVTAVMAELPVDWDLVQFQNTKFNHGLAGCSPDPALDTWQLCTSLMGAYAYMVSPAGARKLLALAYPIELHVDAYMAFMCRMGHIKMIWHPLIDIPNPDKDSDIAHGAQGILNVPTDMEKHGVVALDTTEVLGIMAMAAVAGGLLALAYAGRK